MSRHAVESGAARRRAGRTGAPRAAPCRHHHGRQRPLGRRAPSAARRRPSRGRAGGAPRPSRRRSRTASSWLTLYAFSSENWRRPAGEVLDLTGLLRHYLRTEIAELTRERRAPARHRRPRRASTPTSRRDLGAAERDDRRQHAAQPDRRPVLRRAGRDRRRRPRRRRGGAWPAGSTRRRSTRRRSPASCPPPACPIPTWSSAPAASSGCRISCCGRPPTPNWCSWTCCGRISGRTHFAAALGRVCPAGAAVWRPARLSRAPAGDVAGGPALRPLGGHAGPLALPACGSAARLRR